MEDLLDIAIIASVDAGRVILSIYNDPIADFKIESKADNSPLTIADKQSNDCIVSHLQRTPYPILSEESAILPFSERKAWKTLWVVDPLDGTKEFIKRNGEFTVNIALVKESIPVIGVIYVPVKNELYWGSEDGGAYKVCKVDAKDTIDTLKAKAVKLPLNHSVRKEPVVVASRSHLTPETEQYINRLKDKFGSVSLTSVGSSIKICLVAEGSADVYPRFAPTMEWDTAAGHAIARAAGREVYHIDECTPLVYNKADMLNPWFIVKPVIEKP